MRKPILKIAAPLLLFVLAGVSAPAGAANHDVAVGGAGLVFTPSSLVINAGDTVTFTNEGGFHNVASDPGAVTQFHCSTACGDSPAGDPSGAAWVQVITFPTPGTVGYHCDAHAGSGMVGTITVNVPVDLQSFSID
jgi:plastocyanin